MCPVRYDYLKKVDFLQSLNKSLRNCNFAFFWETLFVLQFLQIKVWEDHLSCLFINWNKGDTWNSFNSTFKNLFKSWLVLHGSFLICSLYNRNRHRKTYQGIILKNCISFIFFYSKKFFIFSQPLSRHY